MKMLISALAVFGALIAPNTELIMAEQGSVQLVSVPQTSPGKDDSGTPYAATKLVLRSSRAGAKFTTFERISFSALHQVWLEEPFGRPTVDLDDFEPGLYHPDWVRWDSHLLMFRSDVGGGGGGGFDGITETNDGSTAITLPVLVSDRTSISAKTGNGPISMGDLAAFFLVVDVQAAEIDLAYLVVVAEEPDINTSVQMSVGVFGLGLNDADPDDRVQFGVSEPLFVMFTPEPSSLSLLVIAFVLFGSICARHK